MRKVFFIGSNKTGTTTFHRTFLKAGLRAYHNPEWTTYSHKCANAFFDARDVFSDGAGNVNIEWLDKNYDGFFILNTRNVKEWAISRWNHAERNKNSKNYRRKYPNGFLHNDVNDVMEWIRERNNYHITSMEYFKDKKNFVILNITTESSQVILQKLSRASGKSIKSLSTSNVVQKLKSYNKNPRAVNVALKRLRIGPSKFNEIILNV